MKKSILVLLAVTLCSLLGDLPCFPKLLIKIPTRSRPEQFFRRLDQYKEKLSGLVPYHFLISCDIDDWTMNNGAIIERIEKYANLSIYFGNNTSKVAAYNADMGTCTDWDILLVASDDLESQEFGYDVTIANAMNANFPDFDGVLNFHDGSVGPVLNTYPIIGRKYYERFGYIFNPAYQSQYAADEFTAISRKINREWSSEQVLCRHMHAVFGLSDWDELYVRNEGLKAVDAATFEERSMREFELADTIWQQAYEREWSILICTIEERRAVFEELYNKLNSQIEAAGLQDKIEILYFRDVRGEQSIGAKRNKLMHMSRGRYVCYIDDDDDVSDTYVQTIYNALQKNPDCVGLKGIMTKNGGQDPCEFMHSVAHSYVDDVVNKKFYRPPNHLNPMRRDIAIRFAFPEADHGEDYNWTMQVASSGLLKDEVDVFEPYYFYRVSNHPLRQY